MKRILIIEDDKSISEIQKDYLEMSGYEVECAFDGASGLESIRSKSFDLIILDLMLPKKDGFDILKEISDTKEIPVLPSGYTKYAKIGSFISNNEWHLYDNYPTQDLNTIAQSGGFGGILYSNKIENWVEDENKFASFIVCEFWEENLLLKLAFFINQTLRNCFFSTKLLKGKTASVALING